MASITVTRDEPLTQPDLHAAWRTIVLALADTLDNTRRAMIFVDGTQDPIGSTVAEIDRKSARLHVAGEIENVWVDIANISHIELL